MLTREGLWSSSYFWRRLKGTQTKRGRWLGTPGGGAAFVGARGWLAVRTAFELQELKMVFMHHMEVRCLRSFEYNDLPALWDFYVIGIYYFEWFYFQIYCKCLLFKWPHSNARGSLQLSWVVCTQPRIWQGSSLSNQERKLSTPYLSRTTDQADMVQSSDSAVGFLFTWVVPSRWDVCVGPSGQGGHTQGTCHLQGWDFIWQPVLLLLKIRNCKLKGDPCPRWSVHSPFSF